MNGDRILTGRSDRTALVDRLPCTDRRNEVPMCRGRGEQGAYSFKRSHVKSSIVRCVRLVDSATIVDLCRHGEKITDGIGVKKNLGLEGEKYLPPPFGVL